MNLIGCNLIDPDLQVRWGEDYDVPTTQRALAWLKELGFQAVEYSHALHWTDEEVGAVRSMTTELGLIPWSLHAWVGGDVLTQQGQELTAHVLRQAAHVALGLGVSCVVHHTNGFSLYDVESEQRLKAEAEILRRCWRPGFRWALETMFHVAQMEYLLALVEELGPEIAGVNVDTGHANLGDLGAARALRMAGQWLITTHLHDNHGHTDEHLPPGEGLIVWEEVAEALREIGYEGCIMLELTDQLPAERRVRGVRQEMICAASKARWLAEQLARA